MTPQKVQSSDRLLADVLSEDWSDRASSQLPLLAARSVRRRRLVRKLAAGTSVVVALVSVLTFAWSYPGQKPKHVSSVTQARPHKTSPSSGYEIINDTELMSLLKNTRVMIVRDVSGTRVTWPDAQ